jgi:hypothetical protein
MLLSPTYSCFAAPDNPDKTVLIIDANRFMTGTEFHPAF